MSNNPVPEPVTRSQILFYQSEDGTSRIEVRLEEGTVWLSQALIADLYQITKQNVSLHIRNILAEGEHSLTATVKEYLTVQTEGTRTVQRSIEYYNLDMILAIGYRVRSHRGTQFRRWATERLSEYLIKGFVLDDERLREGKSIGADYFDELLERIRDIRASEKRFYQKIKDIYTLAIDYDPHAETTLDFFRIVQNKLHWAITGHTAAEIIAERADASRPNMGLTAWKGARVRKGDVTVAKNYLDETEISQLNRIITMYLDYAEMQAERKQPVYMIEWKEKLDNFLKFNEREILEDAGKVSMEVAQHLALEEYEKFSQRRITEDTVVSDREFENISKKIEHKTRGAEKTRD
ncbi:virulence RhuM family protein [Methanoregula sp.]|uniref:virulence RhuM family protein n=1 Tax=Methanoregula sp. TaxID=2052170 RepID=UPI0023692BDA|nr:virulence RhuM family protein [Methanoregula sp.]MDD1686828.1 virulence RhuM family protein [Methanoregula sp.]